MDDLYFLIEFFFYDHNNLDCVGNLEQLRKCLIDIFINDRNKILIKMMKIFDHIRFMILTDNLSEIFVKIHLLKGNIVYSLSFRKTVKEHAAEDEEN